jgi:hypothetical protein
MNNTGIIIFIVIVFIVPWLFVLIYLFTVNRNIIKNYRSLAEKYGFEVNASKKSGFFKHPVSRGTYRNIPVVIGSFIKEDRRKNSAATFIEVECVNQTEMDFIIVKKTIANSIKYGGKAFTVNDSEFDKKFIVNTNDMNLMFDLLNFSIKYKLLQSLNVGFKGELTLNGSKLAYIEKELIKNNVNLLRIEILLHLLCEMADELKEINLK